MHRTRCVASASLVLVARGRAACRAACAATLEYLAGDAFDGRNNDTPGSARARRTTSSATSQSWTDGANSAATGVDAYKQPFDRAAPTSSA